MTPSELFTFIATLVQLSNHELDGAIAAARSVDIAGADWLARELEQEKERRRERSKTRVEPLPF